MLAVLGKKITPPPHTHTRNIHAHEEYDSLGPICDLPLDPIAAGKMRLLRYEKERKGCSGYAPTVTMMKYAATSLKAVSVSDLSQAVLLATLTHSENS